jgi:uncharacterized membrane protein YbaN (DUF454 family)
MKGKSGVNSDETILETNKFMKVILVIAGTVCVGLGVLGIVLPLLPTTPFLLLATTCYAKSSPRFYNWLMNSKLFGNYIRIYRAGKGIPLRVKIVSIVLLWVTIIFSLFSLSQYAYLCVLLILIALIVTIHISRIKTLNSKDKQS